MKQPRNRCSFCRIVPVLLFIFISIQAVSYPKDNITINADSISYQKENGVIEARGSVEALYKDTKIRADHILYYSAASRIVTQGGFILSRENLDLKGVDLDYLVKAEKGSAESFRVTMGRTWISGESVTIDPSEIFLKNACFSSCDNAVPDYKITAASMTLYPKSGWIVENMGMMYIRNIPIFPVPTYVFDTGLIGGLYGKKNPAPIPDIGANPTDGTYINEQIVWRLSSYSYGLASIQYATNKGLGGGFETNYVLNNNNEGSFRIYDNHTDRWYGGVTHKYYFGDDVPRERLMYKLYDVFQVPPRKKYELDLDVSYRERINYERITQLPTIKLKYVDLPFSFINFRPKAELSLGGVSEESTGVNVFHIYAATSLDYIQPVGGNIDLKPGLDISYIGYDSSGSWTKVLGRIDATKKFSDHFDAGMGYSHLFVNSGGSPFRYENYRFFPYDDAHVSFSLRFGKTSFGAYVSYNTPVFSVRDIDYNATIGLHCFDLKALWRTARGEFSLGVELLD